MGTGTPRTGGYILRPFSEKVGLALSSITRHVATTATLQTLTKTDTAHGQTDVSSGQFQASSLPNHLIYGVYWRSRAGELFSGPGQRRRPLDALAHRMRHEDDVSIMVSGRSDFGERKTRGEVRGVEVSNKQQTNFCGHHGKAPVGRGGSDRVVVIQGHGRTRNGGTAQISFAGTPLRGGRTSARAEETTALPLEKMPSRGDQ